MDIPENEQSTGTADQLEILRIELSELAYIAENNPSVTPKWIVEQMRALVVDFDNAKR